MPDQHPSPHLALGVGGEDLAVHWYRDHGYAVVDRNWRTTFGEIDLVAVRGRTLVICEVKTRRSSSHGSPAYAVGWDKQRRLRRLATAWLAAQGRHPHYDVRFDVAAVVGTDVTVYEDAF
jgi:putative endonuclease